jgi:hypothetical protein
MKPPDLSINSLRSEWKRQMCSKPAVPAPEPAPVARPSPWLLQHRVLLAHLQICSCGATYPVFQPALGVQFLNKRTGLVHIVVGHPAIYNQSVPVKTHWREERIYWCLKCLAITAHAEPLQLALDFDFC